MKNTVEVPEYLLVSEELFCDGDTESSGLAMHEIDLDLEGIGLVQSHFVDVGAIAAPVPEPSWRQRIGATFAMVGRGVPYAVSGTRRRAATLAG